MAIQLSLRQISSTRDRIEEIEVLPFTIYSVRVSPFLKIQFRCCRLIISSVLRTNFQTDITWAIQLRLREISSPRVRIIEIEVLPNTIYTVQVSPFLKIQLRCCRLIILSVLRTNFQTDITWAIHLRLRQ